MRLRAGFVLKAGLFLTYATGALLSGAGWVAAEPITANTSDQWWYRGYIDAGGRTFLNNPQRNGVASQGGQSLAKYYEYSTIKPGAFLDAYLAAGSKNGLYQVDLWAKNVGYNDQSYLASLSKAGEHYLTLGWDQLPHLYSTSAQTIYNGVGTNALTLPAGIGDSLYTATGALGYWPCLTNSTTSSSPCNSAAGKLYAGKTFLTPAANAGLIQNVLNNNMHATDIGIRRDTASVEYRWTPTEAWDVKVDYSNTHRTGTQVDGVTFGWGTSSSRVDAPRPVNDTTQNYGLGGEYAGTSPWGQKFNFKLAYNGSTYTDSYDSYTIANPFCRTSDGVGACAQPGTPSSPLARMSLAGAGRAGTAG